MLFQRDALPSFANQAENLTKVASLYSFDGQKTWTTIYWLIHKLVVALLNSTQRIKRAGLQLIIIYSCLFSPVNVNER